jgi:hypothetical protein
MQVRLVASPEAAAIILKGRRGYRRIAESRMAIYVRSFSLVHIAPRGGESIVKALPGYFLKLRRRRRLVVNRMRMRTSSQSERQHQCCQSKPFLHVIPSKVVLDATPIRLSRRS